MGSKPGQGRKVTASNTSKVVTAPMGSRQGHDQMVAATARRATGPMVTASNNSRVATGPMDSRQGQGLMEAAIARREIITGVIITAQGQTTPIAINHVTIIRLSLNK